MSALIFAFIPPLLAYGLVKAFADWVDSPREPKPKPKPKPCHIHMPMPEPYQPLQPFVPGTTEPWVRYALQHPEVKLDMVEKYEVEEGQFIAEKHMKMTGPVAGPSKPPQTFRGISYMPAKMLENHPDLR